MTGSIGLSDSSSAISNTGWGCSWDYDRYGNRWHQNAYNGSCPTPTFSFTQQNNRIDGYSYDAAGNLLSGGTHTYVYDAENRIVSGDNGSFTYVYDAQGRRVKRTGTENVEYLYDLGGSAVTTLSASDGSWIRGEIYAGGHHIGTYADSTTYFTHADWLGTERAHTQMDGGLHQWCTNLPFGDAQNCTGSDPSPRHFTGKERDSESGLDEFGARYYSSSMGRFMTPDWAAKPTSVPYANFGNPQSLNLYSYVENNPTTTGDPDGHGEWYDPNGRHLGTDGVNDGRVVIQNASAVSYSSDHSLVDVAGSGIPMYDISGHVGNAIQDSVSRTLGRTGSDTQGGFHEEGFTVDSNGVHNAAPGPAYRPGDDEAHINLTINSGTIIIEHTHPAGTTDPSVVMGGTHFNQEPSTMHNGKPGDIQNVNKDNEVAPGAMHIVAGAGDNTVRFYNQNGTQARVPLNAFPRCENGNNCH